MKNDAMVATRIYEPRRWRLVTAPRTLTEADRETLARVIAKRWPACCREAQAGVGRWVWHRPESDILDAGMLVKGKWVSAFEVNDEPVARALAILADDLEHDPDLCLDIAREPGKPPRVLGWATAAVTLWRGKVIAHIVDLDIRHPARVARDERIHRERMARLEAAGALGGVNPKTEQRQRRRHDDGEW